MLRRQLSSEAMPIGLILLCLLAIAGFAWRMSLRHVIAQGRQESALGFRYGYDIENYLFTNELRLTF